MTDMNQNGRGRESEAGSVTETLYLSVGHGLIPAGDNFPSFTCSIQL